MSSTKGKEVILSESTRFKVGYYDTIGNRDEMEDSMTICGSMNKRDYMDYFALFDGHGGKSVSHHLANTLHEKIIVKMKEYSTKGPEIDLKDDDMISVFEESFSEMDKEIAKKACRSGATGLVALIIRNKIYCANAGDSRAILASGKQAFRLSRDHKPNLPDEKERIEESGGFVVNINIPRINGRLAVSRAFGDNDLGDLVTALPHVSIVDMDKLKMTFTDTANSEIEGHTDVGKKMTGLKKDKDQPFFLVLACDGLWDVMEDKEVASFISKLSEKGEKENEIAKALVKEALKRRTNDNVSVLLVRLNPEK